MGLFDGLTRDAMPNATSDTIAVVPVISEQLTVHKTMADIGGVRIHKQIRNDAVTIDEPLLKQVIEVTHTAIGKEIDAPMAVRYEGDETIIPVVEERLVLRRQLFLVEEVRIRRRDQVSRTQQEVTLRHEEVSVERQDMESGAWRPEAAAVVFSTRTDLSEAVPAREMVDGVGPIDSSQPRVVR